MTDTHHVVVLDCNIILRLADYFRHSFTVDNVETLLKHYKSITPSINTRVIDAAKALTLCNKKTTFAGEPLTIATSRHILDIITYKENKSRQLGGLGLSMDCATDLADFLAQLSEQSYGRIVERHDQTVEHNPPLDHEDGMVYGLCRKLAGEDSQYLVWCVTFDKDFIANAKSFPLSQVIRVETPCNFISYHQSQFMQRMHRPRSGRSK